MSNSAGGKSRLVYEVPSGKRVRAPLPVRSPVNAKKKGGEGEEAEGEVRPNGGAHPFVLHCG
jgi:hypothetical protein